MKVLDLHCPHGHLFEGWFASEDDFQGQLQRQLVLCPVCGPSDITNGAHRQSIFSGKKQKYFLREFKHLRLNESVFCVKNFIAIILFIKYNLN